MMWIWGKLAIWALRRHIARELRPHCEATNVSREDALAASAVALSKHFDAAWPQVA